MVVSNCASILVAIALPEEHDLLLEKFPSEEAETISGHLICKHKVSDVGLELFSVLAADMGTDAAFDAVEAAIEKLNPNFVICIGIAGSISSDLKVGDIVSSEPDPKVVERYQPYVIQPSVRADGVAHDMDWYCPART
jgi:nucleoside phosphorylase